MVTRPRKGSPLAPPEGGEPIRKLPGAARIISGQCGQSRKVTAGPCADDVAAHRASASAVRSTRIARSAQRANDEVLARGVGDGDLDLVEMLGGQRGYLAREVGGQLARGHLAVAVAVGGARERGHDGRGEHTVAERVAL